MSSDDYIDLAIIIGVAAAALYLLNKAGAFVSQISSDVNAITGEVSNIL